MGLRTRFGFCNHCQKLFMNANWVIPLVWMFHDRATNSKLNHIHERALRLVCRDSVSELEKLKKKYGTIHLNNLQLLMIEIFKTKTI